MIHGDALRALAAAGATTEMIIALVEADAAATEARDEARKQAKREAAAERQRRFKAARKAESNAGNALPAVTGVISVTAPLILDKETSPRPPKEINPIPVGIAHARKGFPIPDGVTADQWLAFCQQRKKKLNDRAYDLLTNKLRTLARDGWPPGEMIDLAIERGWETVFKPTGSQNGNRPANDQQIANPRLRAAVELDAERNGGIGHQAW